MSLARAICKRLAATTNPAPPVTLTFTENGAGGNVFTHTLPSAPDVAIAVTVEPGAPELTKAPTDRPTVRVTARGPIDDAVAAEALMVWVIGELNCLDGVWLDPDGDDRQFLIGSTAVQSTPATFGADGSRRHRFFANFDMRVHAPTTHRPATAGV